MVNLNYETKKRRFFMRRFLSLTLVAVMLLSTLMLTACDPIGAVMDFFSDVVGHGKGNYTVTEEEWLAINKISNFSFKGGAESEGESISIDLMVDNNLLMLDQNMLGELTTVGADLKAGILFTETSVGWLAYQGLDIGRTSITLEDIGLFHGIEFADLTFDEDAKCYRYEKDYTKIEFYFEDGILQRALVLPVDPEEVGAFEITDIGTTVIDVDYTIINDGKIDPSDAPADARTEITADDLNALADMRNFTIKGATAVAVIAVDIGLKMADDSAELTVNAYGETMSQYATVIDGVVYSIEEYRDGHLATSTNQELLSLESMLDELDVSIALDYLVYNEEGRYYELDADFAKFYFYFENGMITKAVASVPSSSLGGDFDDIIGGGATSPAPMDEYEEATPTTSMIEIIFLVTDVGTTEVILPEYTMNVSN